MTTPAEKDAMALAVIERAADRVIASMHSASDERLSAELREARAHLAARVAEDADEIFRLNARLIEETNRADRAEAELASANAKLDASIATGNSLIAEREILYRKLGEAEAELAAVREDADWIAKMEAFIGPSALTYMRREFDAARGAG